MDLFGKVQDQPFGRKLSRRGAGRLPITVVTGFLGAGKSTLIKTLLTTPEGAHTALIVNEFGEVGIDDALLRGSSEETVLLGNGCLCCLSGTDLQLTLKDLFAERLKGSIPDFRRVIIETSGLADPSPILQTLAADRALDKYYFLEGMVTVVDAATALTTADTAVEWSKQIVLADRIIFSKTDCIPGTEFETVRELVQRLAPAAVTEIAHHGTVDPAFLLGTRSDLAEAERQSAFLCEQPSPAEGNHSQAYNTFTITIEQPLPWPAFELAMNALASLRGPDLLRVKGFVNIVGREGPVVVHFVQHLAHQPEELKQWPPGVSTTQLVFITRNIDKERIVELLKAILSITAD